MGRGRAARGRMARLKEVDLQPGGAGQRSGADRHCTGEDILAVLIQFMSNVWNLPISKHFVTVGFLHIFTLHIHTRFDKFRYSFLHIYARNFSLSLLTSRLNNALSFLYPNMPIFIQSTVCFYCENATFGYSSHFKNYAWLENTAYNYAWTVYPAAIWCNAIYNAVI